jgi:DNA-binding CsgD family transcriptional regulator
MLTLDPPNVDGARETARRTIRDGNRAPDVITRLRALFSKKDTIAERVDLNDATREVVALSLSELQRNRVILRSELADDLPRVTGDRVQLQQVTLNLLRNGSDAMNTVHDRPRDLLIRTDRNEDDRAYASLTHRERQVMALLVSGLLTKQVDGELGISEFTVKAHRDKVMQKMKSDSLAGLVKMAARFRLPGVPKA